jgi:hypothetical protein
MEISKADMRVNEGDSDSPMMSLTNLGGGITYPEGLEEDLPFGELRDNWQQAIREGEAAIEALFGMLDEEEGEDE